MSNNRSYRTLLSSDGLVFLGGEELQLNIRNLSVTGLLAELKPGNHIRNIDHVHEALEVSTTVDVFIPELKLAGEAEVARAEEEGVTMLLGMEFKNIVYEASDLLYKRKVYRKSLVANGIIGINSRMLDFEARNVSVEGMMVSLNQAIEVEPGLITIFDFTDLGIKGKIKVIWCEVINDNTTLLGLEYVSMENNHALAVPGFQIGVD